MEIILDWSCNFFYCKGTLETCCILAIIYYINIISYLFLENNLKIKFGYVKLVFCVPWFSSKYPSPLMCFLDPPLIPVYVQISQMSFLLEILVHYIQSVISYISLFQALTL